MLAKKSKFILAVAVQLCVIFGIIIYKVSVISSGVSVILPIEPVDPRDLLRGDYITFQYKISNLDQSLFAYSPVNNGDTVYVPLKEESGICAADKGVMKKMPKDKKGLYLRGKVVSSGGEKTFHIIYGIEEYFIPEGEGARVSTWKREDKACADIKVDKHGRAAITKIIVNDKPWP